MLSALEVRKTRKVGHSTRVDGKLAKRKLDTQSGSSPNVSEECVEGLNLRWFTDKHDV